MNKPEETTPTTPAAPARELTELEKFLAQPMPTFEPSPYGPNARLKVRRRKALRIEVSQRTFDAVRANPGDLKLLAKDRHGNAVVERPHRPRTGPISESEVGPREYERIRAESIGRPRLVEPQAGSLPALPYGSAPDQRWSAQRGWDGVTRYVPDNGGSNPNVSHVYDVFDVLRED
jgi:hypothetical protein